MPAPFVKPLSFPPTDPPRRDAQAVRRERQRCRFLQSMGILDTAPEPFTDAVLCAAASIANVPMAAISMVDEQRQWFKSSLGLGMQETARDVSFCTHTILSTAPLVIEDASLDARFAGNPIVNGDLHVRFYAGFPLIVDGHPLGALCVIDDHPRRLTASQCDRLATLATGTMAWLSKRRGVQER